MSDEKPMTFEEAHIEHHGAVCELVRASRQWGSNDPRWMAVSDRRHQTLDRMVAAHAREVEAASKNCGLIHRQGKCPDCKHTTPDHWQECPRWDAYWEEMHWANIHMKELIEVARREEREACAAIISGSVGYKDDAIAKRIKAAILARGKP